MNAEKRISAGWRAREIRMTCGSRFGVARAPRLDCGVHGARSCAGKVERVGNAAGVRRRERSKGGALADTLGNEISPTPQIPSRWCRAGGPQYCFREPKPRMHRKPSSTAAPNTSSHCIRPIPLSMRPSSSPYRAMWSHMVWHELPRVTGNRLASVSTIRLGGGRGGPALEGRARPVWLLPVVSIVPRGAARWGFDENGGCADSAPLLVALPSPTDEPVR